MQYIFRTFFRFSFHDLTTENDLIKVGEIKW